MLLLLLETLNPQSFINFFEQYQQYLMECSKTVIKDQVI